MNSNCASLEARDDVGYLVTVAKQLQIHGLPHDADQIVFKLEEVRNEPNSIARLREEVSGKFLHYFEI